MGLARIAIAVLAVTLALGLVIVGGVSLYGALTKDASKTASSSPDPSTSGQATQTAPGKAVIIVPGKLPIGGSSPLTDDMIDQIMAGQWSFKVNAPAGPIVGKIVVLNRGVNP